MLSGNAWKWDAAWLFGHFNVFGVFFFRRGEKVEGGMTAFLFSICKHLTGVYHWAVSF
jgi:hypothetical protein